VVVASGGALAREHGGRQQPQRHWQQQLRIPPLPADDMYSIVLDGFSRFNVRTPKINLFSASLGANL
jgi:hypothetical protein